MNKTKADLVQEIYGNDLTIDYALPLGWVREWEQVYQKRRYRRRNQDVRFGSEFNPVPHFVWAYPERFTFGIPAPLTIEGLREIHNMGWPYHEPPYESSIAVEFSERTD